MWQCEKCGLTLPIKPTGKVYCVCENSIKLEAREPNIIQKAVNFAGAVTKHIISGLHKCTQEQIDNRLSICKGCELYIQKENGGVCGHQSCGCNLKNEQVFLNKLAWADQQCPLGKWSKIEPEAQNGVQS